MTSLFIQQLLISAGVFAVGAALLAMAYLVPTQRPWWGHLLTAVQVLGVVVTSLGLMAICLVGAGGFGLVVWFVLMVMWARAVTNFRNVQRRNLLSALALAAEKQMPLAPVARAFAAEQGGSFSRQIDEMAGALEHGAKLADLPARWRAILPRESALAVRVGLETGDLNGALKAATYSSLFDRSMLQPVIARIFYVSVVIFYMVVVLTFVLIKVMPSYVKIFDDFATALPPASRSLIAAANFMSPLIGPALLLLIVALAVYSWLQWRGSLRPRLPGLWRIINWVDMAPVLRMLALATRRDRPLDEVLRAVAQHHPKRSVRSRVWPAAFDIEDGQPWSAALVRQRLISGDDAALLSAAQRSGNLSWAFGETAAGYERKASLRLHAIAQVALPLVILPIGMLVAWVALAFFTPIVRLISDLS